MSSQSLAYDEFAYCKQASRASRRLQIRLQHHLLGSTVKQNAYADLANETQGSVTGLLTSDLAIPLSSIWHTGLPPNRSASAQHQINTVQPEWRESCLCRAISTVELELASVLLRYAHIAGPPLTLYSTAISATDRLLASAPKRAPVASIARLTSASLTCVH